VQAPRACGDSALPLFDVRDAAGLLYEINECGRHAAAPQSGLQCQPAHQIRERPAAPSRHPDANLDIYRV